MAVVGGGATHLLEEPAARRQGLEVSLPDGRILTRDLAQAGDVFRKARELRIDRQIGPECGNHLSLPAGGGDLPVVFEGIQGGVRRGERLDVEAVIKRAGPEFRPEKRRREPVVDLVRVGRIEALIDAEEEKEDVLEPHPGGGSSEEVIMLREKTPDFSGIGFDRPAVRPGDTELLEGNPLAVEHPEQVMVRDQKQLRWV